MIKKSKKLKTKKEEELFKAIENNDIEKVKLLVKNGVNVNYIKKEFVTREIILKKALPL